MTPEQMAAACVDALANETGAVTGVSLTMPRGFKRPPGFPRGELLCETERGRVYSFDPLRVLTWLAAKGFVASAALNYSDGRSTKQGGGSVAASKPTVDDCS